MISEVSSLIPLIDTQHEIFQESASFPLPKEIIYVLLENLNAASLQQVSFTCWQLRNISINVEQTHILKKAIKKSAWKP